MCFACLEIQKGNLNPRSVARAMWEFKEEDAHLLELIDVVYANFTDPAMEEFEDEMRLIYEKLGEDYGESDV